MKMKTSELKGAALDWAVAKAKGYADFVLDPKRFIEMHETGHYNYSTEWAQGGPIIEREKVCVAWLSKEDLGMEPEHYCVAHIDGVYCYYGPKPLIAAMRCYVASKLGEEVEVLAGLI
jgi:hypothetical protein